MVEITSHIRIYNAAFKIAWDHAVSDSKLAPGAAPKLSEQVTKLIKDGQRDPIEIGRTAYENVFKPSSAS